MPISLTIADSYSMPARRESDFRPQTGEAAVPLTEGVVLLDARIYPEHCIREATSAYTPFLTVTSRANGPHCMSLDIQVQPEHGADALRIRREYLNFLLDLSIRHYLGSR